MRARADGSDVHTVRPELGPNLRDLKVFHAEKQKGGWTVFLSISSFLARMSLHAYSLEMCCANLQNKQRRSEDW